jgi:shikimate dehydrogenase
VKTEFGLIGYPLDHSRSPEIQSLIYRELGIDAGYSLFPIPPEGLEAGLAELKERGIRGVNVTIPHKLAVMPMLDRIDPEAESIGSVNVVLFGADGSIGYNTDAKGFRAELERIGFDAAESTVVILGHGGSFRPVYRVLTEGGVGRVIVVGRNPERLAAAIAGTKAEPMTFAEATDARLEGDLLVNCTPVGMYPRTGESPVGPEFVSRFGAVIDLIYNPEETRLISYARERGISTANGLYMLVAQAVESVSVWFGVKLFGLTDRVYSHIPKIGSEADEKPRVASGPAIYLVGMPGSGKTTIGRSLARALDVRFVDLDDLIVRREGKSVDALFAEGEERFRDAESGALEFVAESARAALTRGRISTGRCEADVRVVVATGGGAVLRQRNVFEMKRSGTLAFLDRPLESIINDLDRSTRPLLRFKPEHIYAMHEERYPIYRSCCDVRILNDGTKEETIRRLISVVS